MSVSDIAMKNGPSDKAVVFVLDNTLVHMDSGVHLDQVLDNEMAACVVVSTAIVRSVQSLLQRHQLADQVDEMSANPLTLENKGKMLRVRLYVEDHMTLFGWLNCPSTVCKGAFCPAMKVTKDDLDSSRSFKPYFRVIYVGDGTRDFCPALRLSKNDVVLARSHLLNGQRYGMQRQINANSNVVQAPVVSWSTGYDMYRHFVQFCRSPYVIPHAARRLSGSVLVIFDYDWSLINENSDTFIFQKLYPELLLTLRGRLAKEPSWTKIMNDMLGDLAEDKPDTSSDMILAAAACVPIQPHMLDALRLATEQYSADVKIVSDANSVYIESMVQHYGLTQKVSEVITNPASFESLNNGRNRLRVRPYHKVNTEPHGCKWCPTNMCKGRIVDTLRSTHPYASVLYVGDGSGDFCAAMRLTKNDVVFARADEADGKSYGLQKRIDSNPALVEASVVPWSTGDDIYRHFAQFFHVSLS